MPVGLVLVPLMIAGSVWLLINHVPDNTPEAEEMSGLRISYEFSENYHYAKIEQDYVGPVEKFLNAEQRPPADQELHEPLLEQRRLDAGLFR